jgi:hypothetical protein
MRTNYVFLYLFSFCLEKFLTEPATRSASRTGDPKANCPGVHICRLLLFDIQTDFEFNSFVIEYLFVTMCVCTLADILYTHVCRTKKKRSAGKSVRIYFHLSLHNYPFRISLYILFCLVFYLKLEPFQSVVEIEMEIAERVKLAEIKVGALLIQ